MHYKTNTLALLRSPEFLLDVYKSKKQSVDRWSDAQLAELTSVTFAAFYHEVLVPGYLVVEVNGYTTPLLRDKPGGHGLAALATVQNAIRGAILALALNAAAHESSPRGDP